VLPAAGLFMMFGVVVWWRVEWNEVAMRRVEKMAGKVAKMAGRQKRTVPKSKDLTQNLKISPNIKRSCPKSNDPYNTGTIVQSST